MKQLIFSFTLLFISISATSQENGYEKRVNRYREKWGSFIPTHMKLQYAGSMGFLSLGTGWDYGKNNQWETDFFIGFVPKYSTDHTKITFTLKQNFIPWEVNLDSKQRFSFDPLTCGLYVNTISGDEFWSTDPDRYPKGYYNLSTKIRFHIFVGERITFNIPPEKRLGARSVTLFYEISSCDLYIMSAVQNSYLNLSDILHLSLGVKFQLF